MDYQYTVVRSVAISLSFLGSGSTPIVVLDTTAGSRCMNRPGQNGTYTMIAMNSGNVSSA